ncbi:B3 domain-containing protein [Actinidia chinensis var. chinensis]|uniref:B3 domain-containing protein n=1 Tax=Actinidia chinensis var. chinensis TaxID=1590841 RepID=A0A2R6RN22_ACTCC|nr:B3 domain-containing protein [Actinidia chinensis var. chinensis]
MGEECKDCRKWEEDMYWTRFQSIMFCQFLSKGFEQQLAIPKKFANHLQEKLPENVTIKGPSGAKWNVGLVTSGDTMLFKQGWKVFVEDHSLEEDDVLIFKYNGDSRFDVLIFNGRNLCEREASYFVRKCGHTELDGGSRTKRNIVESSVEVSHTEDYAPSKRPKKDDNATPVKKGRHDRDNGRIRKGARSWLLAERETTNAETSTYAGPEKVNSNAKKGSGSAYPVQHVSNRRLVTEGEKEKALQMAHAASTKDSIIVVMRLSHVYRGFYMSIPSEWALSHLPRKSQEVILRMKEKTWHARFNYKVYGGGLTGGWRNFAFENNLEEFDVCLFELAGGITDAIVMDVSVFRVVDEVTPLTRVTSFSSPRGKQSKRLRRKKTLG